MRNEPAILMAASHRSVSSERPSTGASILRSIDDDADEDEIVNDMTDAASAPARSQRASTRSYRFLLSLEDGKKTNRDRAGPSTSSLEHQ